MSCRVSRSRDSRGRVAHKHRRNTHNLSPSHVRDVRPVSTVDGRRLASISFSLLRYVLATVVIRSRRVDRRTRAVPTSFGRLAPMFHVRATRTEWEREGEKWGGLRITNPSLGRVCIGAGCSATPSHFFFLSKYLVARERQCRKCNDEFERIRVSKI